MWLLDLQSGRMEEVRLAPQDTFSLIIISSPALVESELVYTLTTLTLTTSLTVALVESELVYTLTTLTLTTSLNNLSNTPR